MTPLARATQICAVALLAGCAPSVRSASLPIDSGALRIGAVAPPPGSIQPVDFVCGGPGRCPKRVSIFHYRTYLPPTVVSARAFVSDSTVDDFIFEFDDTVSVEAATPWVTHWLHRRPSREAQFAATWRGDMRQVQLGLTSRYRMEARVSRLEARGFMRDPDHAGERWRICTEVDVRLCPVTPRVGDLSAPYY